MTTPIAGSGAVVIGGALIPFPGGEPTLRLQDVGYDFDAAYYIHNKASAGDALNTLIGTSDSPWASGSPSFVYSSPVPGKVPRVAGMPVGPTGFEAYFGTRAFDGTYGPPGGGGPTSHIVGWEEDLGFTVPWAGHETHTGGAGPIIVPVGDLEERTLLRMRRDAPINCVNAKLIHTKTLGFPPVYDFDIPAAISWPAAYNYPEATDFANLQVVLGNMYSPALTPPDFDAYEDVFAQVIQSPPYPGGSVPTGNVNLGEVEFVPIGGVADIAFRLIDADGKGDANWNGHYCNLDIVDRFKPSERWPYDFQPFIGFRFCPLHIGLLILDGENQGLIQVFDKVQLEVTMVQMTVPHAPGWGVTENRFEHTPDGSDSGWEYTHHSYVEDGAGFLHLVPPPTVELVWDYGFSNASVSYEWRDDNQLTFGYDWAYEFIGRVIGGEGVGDDFWGPQVEIDFWPARLFITPGPLWMSKIGLDHVVATRYQYASPVDIYSDFHVIMRSSPSGWAIRVWQEGEAQPTTWWDWAKDDADPDGGYFAAFLNQLFDISNPGDESPYLPVDIKYRQAGYRLIGPGHPLFAAIVADPLVFGVSPATMPTGGSVPPLGALTIPGYGAQRAGG